MTNYHQEPKKLIGLQRCVETTVESTGAVDINETGYVWYILSTIAATVYTVQCGEINIIPNVRYPICRRLEIRGIYFTDAGQLVTVYGTDDGIPRTA